MRVSIDCKTEPVEPRVFAQRVRSGGTELNKTGPAFAVAAFFSLFLSFSQLVIPLFSMQIFDRVLPSASLPTLVALSAVTACLIAISSVVDANRGVLLTRLANKIYLSHYEPLVKQLAVEPGAAAGLLRDLEMIKGFLTGPLVISVLDLPCTLAFLAAIFFLHPLLGYLTIASSVIMFGLGVVTHFITTNKRDVAMDVAAESSEILGSIVHPKSLAGSMGLSQRAIVRLIETQSRLVNINSVVNERQAQIEAISRGARNLIQLAMLACAAFLVVSQNARTGSIVAASMLLSRSMYPVERLASGFSATMIFLDAARRIKTHCRSQRIAQPSLELPQITGKVEVRSVGFRSRFNTKFVLKEVNFSLSSGQVLAIVGREGAGKSILAKLLVGLEAPTTGDIRFDGFKLADFDAVTLGDQIGFLQEALWIQDATAISFISRGQSNATSAEIIKAAELFDIHSVIQKLSDGYQTKLHSYEAILSSGQLQRLALARAFYGQPRIIILDEPSLHLDDRGETLLLTAISKFKAAGTTFVVTSRLPGLLHLADQLLMLEDGMIRLIADQNQMQGFLAPRLATSQVA